MLLFQKKVQAVAATAEAKFGAKPIKVQQTAHTGGASSLHRVPWSSGLLFRSDGKQTATNFLCQCSSVYVSNWLARQSGTSEKACKITKKIPHMQEKQQLFALSDAICAVIPTFLKKK